MTYEKCYTDYIQGGACMHNKLIKKIGISIAAAVLAFGYVGVVEDSTYTVYADSLADYVIEDGVVTDYKGAGGKIAIPDGVKAIGPYAFYCNEAVKEITLPSSVTYIENGAFRDCHNLEKINLPESITAIGSEAFESCYSMKEIKLPSKITVIEAYTFDGCNAMVSVNIPESVVSIGMHAFDGDFSIASLNIPRNVNQIGEYAFRGCSALESITVDSANITYNSKNNCNALIETATNKLILGCKNTRIPDGVKSIGDSAFYACDKLQSIAIPEGVSSIGEYAFYYCTELNKVELPKSIAKIDSFALDGCSGLYNIIYSGDEKDWNKISVDLNLNGSINKEIVSFKPVKINNPFKDIPAGKWYTDAVLFVNKRGAMTGLDATTFGPTVNLSRAMTVQLLWKLEGSVKQNVTADPFPDVAKTHWSADAVSWAKKNGIAGGYTSGAKAGLFGKSDNITRQEFIKIIYGYAKFKGYNVSVSSKDSYKKVKDAGTISSWAVESMNWGYENGLVANGSDFKAKDDITRAEAAVILYRFLGKYE